MTNQTELQTIEDIKNLFDEANQYLKDYNEEDTLNTLNNIADELNDFDINTNLSNLGENLDSELHESFATEDELEETILPYRLESTGVQGVAYMLTDYDGNYNVHYIDAYGNIEDTNLYNNLKDLLNDYKKDFEEIIK